MPTVNPQKTKYLMTSRYKGVGRPRNSDYVECDKMELEAVKATDKLLKPFNT